MTASIRRSGVAVDWFAGRTAIVTGAAQGIGRAVAELLEALGARVIAVDRDARALAEGLTRGRFVHCHGDLATSGAQQLAEDIWQRHGPIELLVNNVGIETRHRFLELGEEEFDLVFDTNLRGPWFFTKQIAEHLVNDRRTGAIVFVSSLHERVVRTFPHYSASKAAVAMLVRELAHDLGPSGIRVNAVAPGTIRTAYNRVDTPGEEAIQCQRIPLGRVGEPADVARIVAVLLSDQWSGYVTGANVQVDGGLGLHSWSAEPQAERPALISRDRLVGRARRLLRRPG